MNVNRIRMARNTTDAIRAAISKTSEYLSNIEASNLPLSVYDEWKPNVFYDKAGKVIVYKDETYRIVQPHTSQAHYPPDTTITLYTKFTSGNQGGISYRVWIRPTGGHDLPEKGLNYLFRVEDGYNGKIYECLTPSAYDYMEVPSFWKLIN